jgi:hypothetical protein
MEDWLALDEYEAVTTQVAGMVTSVAPESMVMFLGDAMEKGAIQEDRERDGNPNQIVFDPVSNLWMCMGCDEALDTEPNDFLPGDCACWEKICTDCTKFAFMCSCDTEGWCRQPVWLSEADESTLAMAIDSAKAAYTDPF